MGHCFSVCITQFCYVLMSWRTLCLVVFDVFAHYLQHVGETVLILFSLHFPAVYEDLPQERSLVSNPPWDGIQQRGLPWAFTMQNIQCWKWHKIWSHIKESSPPESEIAAAGALVILLVVLVGIVVVLLVLLMIQFKALIGLDCHFLHFLSLLFLFSTNFDY